MIKVYILEIKPEYEDFYSENVLYCKRITGYSVDAMVHIDDVGIPDIERGTYIFNSENMPDSFAEIENTIKSMYVTEK